MTKIRNKLIILFAIIVIPPILIIGILSYSNAKTVLEKQALDGLIATAKSRENALLLLMRLRIEEGEMLNSKSVLKRILTNKELQRNGKTIGEVALQQDIDLLMGKELPEYTGITTFYDYIFIGESGIVHLASNESLEGTDFSTDPRFIRGMRENYNSDIFLDQVTGKPAMHTVVGVPPPGGVGKPIGVTIATRGTTVVNAITGATDGLGESGEILIGQKTEDNKVMFVTNLRHATGGVLDKEVALGSEIALPVQQAILGKEGQGISTDYWGEEILAYWKPIPTLGWGLVAKIDTSEAFAPISALRIRMIGIALLVFMLSVVAAYYVSKLFSSPIQQLVNRVTRMSEGELGNEVAVKSNDELGLLSRKVNESLKYMKSVVQAARAVALGDYSVEVKPRSNKDELGNALQKMVGNLRQFDLENKNATWLQTGQAGFAQQLQGNLNSGELADRAIRFLADYLEAQVGAVYVFNEDNKDVLGLAGSYAFNKRKSINDSFKLKQGFVGQAAFEGQIISVTDIPEDYTRVGSAIGDALPRNIIVAPFKYEGEVLGVVELGSLNEFSDAQMALIERTMESLGVAFNSERARSSIVRRQVELAESEERTRSLIETAVDSIIVIDEMGIIQSINNSTTQLFGYQSEELVGNNIKMLMPSPYHEEHDGYLSNYRNSGVRKIISIGLEVTGLRKDGTQFPCLLSVGEMKLGDKKFFSGFIKDITEQKRAQAEIQNQNEELQTQTEELQTQTEELQTQQEELKASNEELEEQSRRLQASEEELQQSNEELEEKMGLLQERKAKIEKQNRTVEAARQELQIKVQELALTSKYKSEFLANMSHELRTPLNSLLILSQQLASNPDENLTDKQVEFAQIINGSGKDLLGLIEEILDLAKIESGKTEIHADGVQFTEILDSMQQAFAAIATERSLKFSTELDDALPPALVTDEKRVKQILRNLLSNAFKFTKEGSVTLGVKAVAEGQWPTSNESLNRAGQVIAFTVTDTGIGIAEDKQGLVFEVFQQAEGGTSREYGGSGLGLSISRELAQLLGGEIKLQSTPGKGSVFTLYLPQTYIEPAVTKTTGSSATVERVAAGAMRVVEAEKTVTEDTTSVPDDRGSIKPGDRVLLIIEDDPVFAKVLLDQARGKGFKGVVSLAGNPGMKLARKLRPDGITLDLRLPDCDGWVILDTLKHDPQTSHIPVHIVSADDEHEQRGLERGAFAYLKKSSNLADLDAALERVKDFVGQGKRRLLVVEDNANERKAIVELIGNGDIETVAVGTGRAALKALGKQPFDCVVVDLDLPDMSGSELMKSIKDKPGFAHLPFVVYTGTDLSRAQETQLKKLAQTIIVKGANSPERLLEETALFLHRVSADLPKEKRMMIKQAHQLDSTLKDKKVLVVDDDVRNIFATTALLEQHQMQVISAENGKDAAALLEKTPDIDVVLMDIMMPEMDGYEAMSKIRSQRKFKSLPIIAMTAKAMKQDRDKCIEAGASDYISKPVDTDQLLSLLRVWLHC